MVQHRITAKVYSNQTRIAVSIGRIATPPVIVDIGEPLRSGKTDTAKIRPLEAGPETSDLS